MEMGPLLQLGIFTLALPSGRPFAAASLLRLFTDRTFAVSFPALVVLLCLSAAAGALFCRLYAQTRLRKKERAVTSELTMLRAITANLPDPLYVKDRESRFLLANKAAAENMGTSSEDELIGKTDFDFFPREIAQSFWEDERKVIVDGQTQISKEECIAEPGRTTRWVLSTKIPLRDPSGQIIGLVGVGRNISALKQAEAELKIARDELAFKASHDSLTSLLSRGAILEMLSRELTRNARENSCSAVLLGDLDHFKEVNDLHGHPIGDQVLREVALRLLKAVRPYDLVGRFGGEEFLIVLPGCAAADAATRADQLRQAIAASPISTSRGPVHITISLGALFLEQWRQPTSDEVLREVDSALYVSKSAGRNCCSVAQPPSGRAAVPRS